MSEPVDLPLSDVRVLDVGDHVAEAATRLLADLGAEVLKAEPTRGSTTRSTGPAVDGRSLRFAIDNANKSCGLLPSEDVDALLRLGADADIVVLTPDSPVAHDQLLA